MSTLKQVVYYPDSDGKPMADNTLQFEWIVTIQGNLDLLFRDDPNVFVAGDHLIYPVEDEPELCQAPDVYVAFGRPKGHRGSYKVWEEGKVFPQVVFEVWSPGNRVGEMDDKRDFYAKYGAEEYYLIYPEHPSHVEAWHAVDGELVRVTDLGRWRSPRLGIRVQLLRGRLSVFRGDGVRFFTFVELGTFAEREHRRAEEEKQRAEAEAKAATEERAKAAAEKERADRLAARLRELGVDPDAT